MIENLEEKFASGFFKKTSVDKLTWKNEIAEAHRYCRHVLHNRDILPDAIESLITTVYLDIEGYKLKDTIDEIHTKTYQDCQTYINTERQRLGRSAYYQLGQIPKLKIHIEKTYWITIFKELTQLLGEKNLLLETERKIPYKQLGRVHNVIQDQ